MTCAGCEQHVNSEISKLEGIVETKTSYTRGTSTVRFDSSKTSLEQIKTAIENTGYKIIH
jgi:mercuric ion transport protein